MDSEQVKLQSKTELVCMKCHRTSTALLCLALAIELGVRAGDPSLCYDGEEHDFVEKELKND